MTLFQISIGSDQPYEAYGERVTCECFNRKKKCCAATVICFKFRVYKRRNRVYSMKGPDISSLSDGGCYGERKAFLKVLAIFPL